MTNAKKESRNYFIKVCPKCGAVDSGFTKGENGTADLKATNTASPTSGDLMKLSNRIGENSMA